MKCSGRQVGQKSEPARVDAQDGRGMVFHPPRRVEDGAIASQHDRHVGGQGREVGLGREIDADQLDPGGLSQLHRPLSLASAWTSGLIPLPRMTSLSGGRWTLPALPESAGSMRAFTYRLRQRTVRCRPGFLARGRRVTKVLIAALVLDVSRSLGRSPAGGHRRSSALPG